MATDKANRGVLPDADSKISKKEQVAEMFDQIAARYDFLNHFLSLGIDKAWRKTAIAGLKPYAPKQILDVATGTGDLAIAALALNPDRVTGVDISEGMLDVGRKKLAEQQLDARIELRYADSERLPFADHSFDAITCAYGVRNFERPVNGLREMQRVLKPGGRLAILEFSHPRSFPFKHLYKAYFRYFLPVFGKLVSKHSRAYTYLPESVMQFPEGPAFCALMQEAGFTDTAHRPLTFGVTSLYTAGK